MEVNDLIAYATKLGINPEDLDEIIHDLKSDEATEINNTGLERQIVYMSEYGMSKEEIQLDLQKIAREKKDQ